MAVAPVWFANAKKRAHELAKAYEQRHDSFERLKDEQLRIFARTDAASYLTLLGEHVRSAYGDNQEAGWLPSAGSTYSDLEFFETLIRHDRSARRFKSLTEVPEFLREEFEDWSDADFRAHAEDLREASRSGYAGLEESRIIMEDEPECEDFFERLYNWPGEAGAPERELAQAEVLVDNLHSGWKRCQKAGLALLHPANYDSPDYDPSLIAALMEE